MNYLKREQEALDRDFALVRKALESQRDVESVLAPGFDETPRETQFADALAALERIAYSIGASNTETERE